MPTSRRSLLAGGATSIPAILAGCVGGGGNDGDGEETTTAYPATDTATATDTGTATKTATATATDTPTGPPEDISVSMSGNSFIPLKPRVAVGGTVTWANNDSYAHNVVSATFHDVAEDWSYASDNVGGGGSLTYTFDSAGVYEYFCDIHGEGTMSGAILVGPDATLDQQLPSEGGGGY